MKKPFIQFGPFKGGIDNVNDPKSLTPDKLQSCSDLIIDNFGFLSMKPTSTLVSSGAKHSLWRNEAKTTCLFVQGTNLKRLNADETSTVVKAGISGRPMSFDEINGTIYFSDGLIIGTTDGYGTTMASDLFNADMTIEDKPFKLVMPPSDIIKFHATRLYSILGGRIIFSDAKHFVSRDSRYCRIYMPSSITMFMPVTDGIWLSFGGKIYFMGGYEPQDFDLKEKANYGALGQGKYIRKGLEGADGFGNKPIRFLTEQGVCQAGDGGAFANLSQGKYKNPANAKLAYSTFREKDGIGHFISSVTSIA